MKKLLSVLLVLAMILSMGIAVAEEEPVVTVVVFDRGNVPADQGSYEDNWATRWVNENAPVRVQYVPCGRWDTYTNYNLWLTAGTCPDIIMEFQPEYVQEWSSKGLILELGDLIDEYAPNYRELTSESVQAWGLYNGGEYAIVDSRAETSVINHMCYIRADWLENLGLEMPTNFDELKEVIRAFTEDDPDGNGENDTYGWSLGLQGQTLVQNMNGGHSGNWIIEDGQLISSYISNSGLESLKFLEEIYDNGWCDKEYLSQDNSDIYGQFASGKLGIICCGVGYLTSSIWEPLMANEPEAKVVALPSVGEYGYYQERECNLLMSIPAACTHPEAAVKFLDWMIKDGWEMLKFGVEGEEFEYQNGIAIRLTTDEQYKAKFNYTQEMALLCTYKDTIASKRIAAEAMSESILTRPAEFIVCDAMEATKDIKFNRPIPTDDLGVAKYTELFPDMKTIASEYWAKAINDPELTAEDAIEAIKTEWAGMGYDELFEAMNTTASALGYLD